MDTASTEIVNDKSIQRWIIIGIAFAVFMPSMLIREKR
jgi:hypothetical protein